MMSNWFKRVVAVMLVFTLALISPMQNVRSDAAEKSVVKYIKEFKLFIKKEGGLEDARNWCKSQTDGDWHVVESDLNAGTDGTFSKPVGVFMCYCTTENPKEAVRDIAVMNEKGKYSEAAYEEILKSQKDAYRDLVKDLKIQVKNYQDNLKNNVKTAVEVRDLLNEYKEDDSGKLLGDLLAGLDLEQETDLDKLTDILLQANGQVVLYIQQQLTLASESGNRSWLDRMEQVGSYDKFYAKVKTAFNGDDSLAKRNMDAKYKEKAVVIADSWDELKSHFENINKYEEKSGVASMSEEQFKEWRKNNLNSMEGATYEQEIALAGNLAKYKYEGKTLLDFFNQDKSEISEKNLCKLYPMVACLQDGQFAGIDSTVNLYSLINQAFSATLLNDYDKGRLKEAKDEMNAAEKKELKESQKQLENMLDNQKKGEVKSVYEGVDREVFNGGVAVTSDALEYSNGTETKWYEGYCNNGLANHLVGVGIVMGILATVFLHAGEESLRDHVIESVIRNIYNEEYKQAGNFNAELNKLIPEVEFWSDERYATFEQIQIKFEELAKTREDIKAGMESITKQTYKESTGLRVLRGLKIGLSIVLILVTVADIAVNVYHLYQYYNREHLPIPKNMIDMSTNENKETAYVTYKSVRDNSGDPGDLNGGSAKQWLALYQTHDDRAGEPIAAPESGYPITVVYGGTSSMSNYLPLHMFGTKNVSQNLTYADGDSGYSYEDKKCGTYLYFMRYYGAPIEEGTKEETKEETVSETSSDSASGTAADVANAENGGKTDGEDQTATALSTGTIALIGASSVVLLAIVILVINYSRKRKKGNIQ